MLISTRRLVAVALLAAAPLAAEIRSLTILHVNYLHARISPLDSMSTSWAA